MKQIIIIATAITLALTSQLVFASAITDTYTTGDTLTATKMNNVKTAVNDNSTKVTANTGNISGNTTDIGINVIAIANNAGASRFYGDGSAGALTISAGANWTTTPPTGNNLNFTNVVVDPGQTLTVPAGTTIRCSGTFTNNGTITVNTGATKTGGSFNTLSEVPYNGKNAKEGNPGDSIIPASAPYWHNAFSTFPLEVEGGTGGLSIPQTLAASSFNSFRIGGGSGSGYSVGAGGGLLKIYCNGAVINAGTINANGANASSSSGGGGGGIVILASQTSVDNAAGTISATGGDGGNGFSWGGIGGGGGGGITLLVAPTITSAGGTITVTAGSAGTSSTAVTTNVRIGGGGGGASGGNGGIGGNISSTSVVGTAGAGIAGYSLEIIANPAHMM